jgi:hypothetical protein
MNSSEAHASENPEYAGEEPESVAGGGEYPEGDARQVLERIRRGTAAILGLAALGMALGITICLLASSFSSTTTSMRVAFAFKGFGRGEYPDHSKFQPDDLRAPDIVLEALKRQGLDTTDDFQTRVRAAITVEGVISPAVTKERDRLRAAGQSPAPYLPDEFIVTLSLPRKFPLNSHQRELVLNEVVSSFQEKFQNTYAELPEGFGSAFDSLQSADFFEYELILDKEIENIDTYLTQQLDQAKTFRSPSTNLGFNDLLRQTEIFAQIQLSETLGLIRENGLSNNRALAMVKMDYYLHTLEDQEQRALAEEKVVDDLLAKAQDRSQNYILGIKSQSNQPRTEAPIIDQGLIDSLLANDSENFLVHEALAAGLKVKRVQADKSELLERRKSMEDFLKAPTEDQSSIIAQMKKSVAALEASYKTLITNIRKTHADFAKQQFADAVRITMQPVSATIYRPLALAAAVGGFAGFSLGIGLSLLGIFIGANRRQ